ncbi:E3 ubiquitin-protein ligase TRIM35-like isoform X1 [Garra rufa]|uniref:E3 ubiquitin-protein ligase TRIM35-like isoform X1 n=1 Tax=Garra rufa TaxID=137080 RepID=UPI003CCE69E1
MDSESLQTAFATMIFEGFLNCPVCHDTFINPVFLSCSHSVCEDCLQSFWENESVKECPVCRTPSNEHPPVNLVLKNLCDSYQHKPSRRLLYKRPPVNLTLNNRCERSPRNPSQTFLCERPAPENLPLRNRRERWSQKPSQRSSFGGESVCNLHKEKLKLFCVDDQEPMCLVCRDSRKHINHRFCPVDEAVMDNKFHAQSTERQIKAEFEELHQFLRNEEAARLTALREQEKLKSQIITEDMEETRRHISSLKLTIRDIEEQMKAEDVSFLQNFRATLQRAQRKLPDSEPIPAVTINFSNHLTNLKLNVLQKMRENDGESMHFNTDNSDFQSATDISNDPVIYNEYKHFPRHGGKGKGKTSRKGSQPISWEVQHANLKTPPDPVHTVQLSHDRPQFPKQCPQYETTETMPCSQTNRPTPRKRLTKNNPGNAEDQNPDMQFTGVKDLVKKMNEQMKM